MTVPGESQEDEVQRAAARLETVARRTPLELSLALSESAGCPVHLKLEGLQRTGSFKLRGAFNLIASLTADERGRGLVTASAGNHGLGVALAARLLGARATVYVPRNAPQTKRRRIARFGAELIEADGGYDDAHARAEEQAERAGAVYVHAFSDPHVVAGQGTVGLEVLDQCPTARTLLVPVGGGGLIGGIGTVAKGTGRDIRIVGVQTTETAAMHASLAAGELCSPPMGPTLCEGLSGDIDARSLELARTVVDEVVLVDEDAVRRAIRWLYVEEGVVAEGSAAVVVAALLENRVTVGEGPVVAVLTGSNVDAPLLAQILLE